MQSFWDRGNLSSSNVSTHRRGRPLDVLIFVILYFYLRTFGARKQYIPSRGAYTYYKRILYDSLAVAAGGNKIRLSFVHNTEYSECERSESSVIKWTHPV